MARPTRIRLDQRTFDARPDTIDFRDRMYTPTLIEVPRRIELREVRRLRVPVRDQGTEGACTGFGLAAVADHLLRRRRVVPDRTPVSARMLYEMARRYDEWAGEAYEGSSARGAMKGWHKHGACAERVWPYRAGIADGRLTDRRARDAATRPLGAYFRVNHKDLVAMHAALAEVGVLFATAIVHEGWEDPERDGVIPPRDRRLGGHAFAIVAYDERGFWVQNSWGCGWGRAGLALVTYDDWLAHGTDAWVARLGVPVALQTPRAAAVSRSAAATRTESYAYQAVRPHVIGIGNDGRLRPSGLYGTTRADLAGIFAEDIPRITRTWPRRRLLLYAHGGLVAESSAVQRVADYRATLLDAQVYPLAFVWKSDLWTTVRNILEDGLARRRPEGLLDATKDFMLDRLDDALEPLARGLGGRAAWDEMKENARLATASPEGGARLAAAHLAKLLGRDPTIEVHLAAHSAGAVFLAPLIQLLTASGRIAEGPLQGEEGYGCTIASCGLWAPACTVDLFAAAYLPAIQSRRIGRFALFTLTDEVEQADDVASIYHKSLLYLVSNAFEARPRVPLLRDGEPILGMEKFVRRDARLVELFQAGTSGASAWVRSPNADALGLPGAAGARHHGDFDDDPATLQASLARMVDQPFTGAGFAFERSATALRDRRQGLGAA